MEELFRYYMDRTEKDLAHIRERVDALWDERQKRMGVTAAITVVGTVLLNLVFLYLKPH